MITPNLLNKVALAVDTSISGNAKVTVNGSDITVNLSRTPVIDNVASVYFTLDNTVSGEITRVVLNDSGSSPLIIEELSIQKSLGSIYVGTFRIVVEEEIL